MLKIHYNHVGYAPQAPKRFLVTLGEGITEVPEILGDCHFEIVDQQGSPVCKGNLARKGVCDYTAELAWVGDFTQFVTEGSFKIKVYLGDQSAETRNFEISHQWLRRQLASTLKSFYYQRSGVELTADRAGKWARPAAHRDDCIEFHPSMNRSGTWNAHGGWYDAGDYGKYIVNGGVSLGTLLTAAEFADDRPVSLGNDSFFDAGSFRANLLEEIRFELDFFLRMQDHDGGVFFKVSPIRWDGFVSPTQSDANQKRQILGKSTTSTLNFAGVLAQAHHVFGRAYPAFAAKCLEASIRAYDWAVKNPEVTYPHNTEGSGGYGDECYDDEFFWARAMLFRELSLASLSKHQELCKSLRETILQDMEKCPPKLGLDWRDTQNLGWIALALQSKDLELQKLARTALEKTADDIFKLSAEDVYGLSIRKFIWGSNGDVSNHALTLLLVNTWKPEKKFVDTAFEMMDFVYGKNPVDTCFVTGAAWSSPKFPHHRICHSDGIEEPIPGLIAGGINNDRQDLHRFAHYRSPLPGYAYTDERCSFASNETAINWNSPLVAALSFLAK